jgi:light-regulated signal transduction histidine kinase (bacteriophytochrome)
LTALQQRLLDLVEADSAAILHNGQILRIGDAPSEIAIYAIAAMVGRDLPDIRSGDLNIYATDCLSNIVPAAADIKDRAAGVLIAALSLNSPAYLFWFRREQIVHATWAGNPTAEGMSRSSEGLNPRASFEAWKQDIRNLSRPWLLEDLELADELARVMRGLEGGAESSVTPPLAGSASFVEPIRPRALANPPTSAVGQPEPHAANGPAQVSRRVIRIGQR